MVAAQIIKPLLEVQRERAVLKLVSPVDMDAVRTKRPLLEVQMVRDVQPIAPEQDLGVALMAGLLPGDPVGKAVLFTVPDIDMVVVLIMSPLHVVQMGRDVQVTAQGPSLDVVQIGKHQPKV